MNKLNFTYTELIESLFFKNNENIPIIHLYYSKSTIFIESKCHKGHYDFNPLNQFLILYHPLIKFTRNFNFCNKCLLKFFHYNITFYSNFCDKCNGFYCLHKKDEDLINKHRLIEIIFPKIDFYFTIMSQL